MADGEKTKRHGSLDDYLPPNFSQTISLAGNEVPHTIHGYEVNIHASGDSTIGNFTSGSSKVKITTVTNQNWELPNHHGNLVASNNQYLAYILEGRSGYVLRLIHLDTNNRALLKGFVGAIQDVAFAHANSNILACTDQGGNLHVWDLDKATDFSKVQSDALCVLIQRSSDPDSLEHRLTWCPFVPHEDEEEHDATVMVAISHGCEVEVFDLKVIIPLLAEVSQVSRKDLAVGGLTIENAHDKMVCDLSLSPDGGVLATAAEDGHLKFWEVNWDPGHKPKCLHDFVPHKGAPVTRLMFCDNHLSQDPSEQFWRFLITGANNNAEVKVWCTVSWKCLQTVCFSPPLWSREGADDVKPHLVMTLDHSAQYLIAADARRMVVYILQFYQEGSLGDASVTSVTEYLLTQPILSFVFSGHTPFPPPDGESGDDGEGDEAMVQREFDSRRNIVLIKLHCIQTRSMQELLVRFEPPDLLGVPPESVFSLPGDEHFKNLGRTEMNGQLKPTEVTPSPPPLVDTPLHHTSPPSQFGSEGVRHPLPTQPSSLPPVTQPSSLPPGTQPSSLPTIQPSFFSADPQPSSLPTTTQPSSLPTAIQPSFFSTDPQPSSLPGDLLAISSSATSLDHDHVAAHTGSDFHSLTTPAEASPKLFTPSAFASPAKTEPTFSHDATDSAFTPVHSQRQSSSSFSVTLTPVTDVRSELSGVENVVKLQASAATNLEGESIEDISSSFELPAHPLQTVDLQQMEQKSVDEGLNLESHEGGGGVPGAEGLIESGPESGESSPVTVESAQQTFDSIFSLLKVENPHASPPTTEPQKFNEAGYEEFKQILLDPSKHWEMLTSTEKSKFETETSEFVAPASKQRASLTDENEGAEIVNAAASKTPTEYLELLRQKVPSESSLGSVEAQQPGPSGEKSEELPWPDIGGPELPKTVKIVHEGELQHEGEPAAAFEEQQPQEELTIANEQSETPLAAVQLQEATPLPGMSEKEPNLAEGARVAEELSVGATTVEVTVFGEASQPRPGELDSKSETLVDMTAPGGGDGEDEVSSSGAGGGEGRGESLGVSTLGRREQTNQFQPLQEQEVREEEPPGVVALSLEEPPPPSLQVPPEAVTLQLQEGTSPRTQRKRKRTRSKKASTELLEVVSHSDGEPTAEPLLVSVEPGLVDTRPVDSPLLSQLYQLVARQQQELQQLREEQQQVFVSLQQQLNGLQLSIVEQHHTSLAEHAREQQQKLDRVLKDKQTMDKQRQDRLIASISQTLTTAVNTKLDKVVRSEMKNNVLPSVNRSMSIIHDQLTSAMEQKLTATDTALRDGITQILQSRGLPEAVGNAVAVSLQHAVQSSYEDVFRGTVLPSFEKACQEMFRQVDEAFQRGTSTYMQQCQQLQEPSLQQLTATVHSLHSLLTTQGSPLYASIQACVQHEFSAVMQHTQQVVSEAVASVVRKEVESSIERHAGKLGSEARLQEERKRKEEEIRKLLQSQDFNMAFELALSTSDLHLVLFLCQQVAPEEVFDKLPCPLSQPVLLSLIQQLSVDLKDKIELKIRYLEQSILALDVSNEVTKSHMPPVLSSLSQHLARMEKTLESGTGTTGLARQVKRLRMVTEHLCQPHGR